MVSAVGSNNPVSDDDAGFFVVISGCSGGGKSTLLREFARRGYSVIDEPGRRIVRAELATKGRCLPWVDPLAFAQRAIDISLQDLRRAAALRGLVFFDRGLIDAAAAYEHLTKPGVLKSLTKDHRYHRRVFLLPPWAEIFATDEERRHSFEDAVEEYERLVLAYNALDYDVVICPKTSIVERVEFVLQALRGSATSR